MKSKEIKQDLSALFEFTKKPNNHLHHELPYRYYDEEHQYFENVKSRGFGLNLTVIGGANDELIKSLNAIVCSLPEGKKWHYQFVMVGNNQVGHLIEQNKNLLTGRGGVCDQFAKNEAIYANYSATNGFDTSLSEAYHYDLKNYNAYLFVSTFENKDRLFDIRLTLESELSQCNIMHSPMNASALIEHVREHLNFNPEQTKPIKAEYNEFETLNVQMLSPDSEFIINRDRLETQHTPVGCQKKIQMTQVNMGLQRLAFDWRLYCMPDCLASLRRTSNSLQCPHRITLCFQINKTGEQVAINDGKIRSLTKTVNSPMRLLIPTAKDELEEREQIQKGLLSSEFKIATMSFNLTLYTSEDMLKNHTTVAASTFREAGLDVINNTMLQGQSTLSSLPFMMSEGFFEDSIKAGRTHMLKTSNLVNFFPIVADVKNFSGGLMLPTMRNQISYFDIFDCGSDNYNIACTGGSGAGKSFFIQKLVTSVYGRGGKVWILDKGQSYKKLTQTLGGVYLTHESIFLNPFTHLGKVKDLRNTKTFGDMIDSEGNKVDPIAEVLGNITGLIATMASPEEPLQGFQRAMVGDAILIAWNKNGNDTLIDHIQQALIELSKSKDNDRRISDIAAQLNKYCSNGIYGDVFNKPSQLDPTIEITTLELDGFKDELKRPVIFALMVAINQQMYLAGQRSIPKLCVIEEAWSLMGGENAHGREFINEGYRTVRKFGGSFCTVTQGVGDFFANAEAKAAFNSSDIHITLRQGDGFNNFIKENPNQFTPFEQKMIKSFPRASDAGHSCLMLKAGSTTTFHRIFADPWSRSMLSTEPKEYEYCETLMRQGIPLMEAIEQTAQHFYPKEMLKFSQLIKNEKSEQYPSYIKVA